MVLLCSTSCMQMGICFINLILLQHSNLPGVQSLWHHIQEDWRLQLLPQVTFFKFRVIKCRLIMETLKHRATFNLGTKERV